MIAGARASALTTALEGVSALDVLRCQAIEAPPRGLVLVVGCVGVLLGLCDGLPNWEECKTVLKGEPLKRSPVRRGAPTSQRGSFWQQLQQFDAAAVTPPQLATTLAAVKADVGGLMEPRHLEQINRAAAALGRWITAVHVACRDAPADVGSPSSSPRFNGSQMARCETCGTQMEVRLLSEHAPLCAARLAEREAKEERSRQARERERAAAQAEADAAEYARRMRDIEPLRVLPSMEADPPPPPPPPPQARLRGAPSPPTRAAEPSPRVASPPPVPPSDETLKAVRRQQQLSYDRKFDAWAPPEGGHDYLRARSGPRGGGGEPALGPRGGEPAAAARRGGAGELGQQRGGPSTAGAAGRTSKAAAAAVAAPNPARAKGGRRRAPPAAAAADDDDDDDDDGPVLVLSREAHVAAIRQKLQGRLL